MISLELIVVVLALGNVVGMWAAYCAGRSSGYRAGRKISREGASQ
jgi:membrane protein DedA with SNARE-associated domain